MKLKNLGRVALALAASAGSILGVTSCSRSFTVGYFFVTGNQPATGVQSGQIASYRIQNDTGQLHQTGNPIPSGGLNPIQAIANSSGTYVYVLNAGCGNRGQAACGANATSAQKSTIQQFSIGGAGVLTPQQTFTMQGDNTLTIALSGNYLYALDQFAPQQANGTVQSIGDITAFAVDAATGRLSLVQNNQQKDPSNNLPLTYFPVGSNPTWLSLGGGLAFIAEQGPASNPTANDPSQAIFIYNQSPSDGQLTLTQNTPTPTGATQLTFIYSSGSILYALDAGPNATTQGPGQILPFTVGAGGTLSGIPGGARLNNAQGTSPVFPSRMIVSADSKFLYVANSGTNLSAGTPGSVITGYFINTTPSLTLTDIAGAGNLFTVGSGPSCIVEDPSSTYLYTANFNDSTITGKKLDKSAGPLQSLPKGLPAPPPSPTWCAVTGSTF